MAPEEVGQKGFVLSRQNILQGALKGVMVDELNPDLLTKNNEITPGAMVAVGKLTNELTNTGELLGDNELAPAALDADWLSELAF